MQCPSKTVSIEHPPCRLSSHHRQTGSCKQGSEAGPVTRHAVETEAEDNPNHTPVRRHRQQQEEPNKPPAFTLVRNRLQAVNG